MLFTICLFWPSILHELSFGSLAHCRKNSEASSISWDEKPYLEIWIVVKRNFLISLSEMNLPLHDIQQGVQIHLSEVGGVQVHVVVHATAVLHKFKFIQSTNLFVFLSNETFIDFGCFQLTALLIFYALIARLNVKSVLLFLITFKLLAVWIYLKSLYCSICQTAHRVVVPHVVVGVIPDAVPLQQGPNDGVLLVVHVAVLQSLESAHESDGDAALLRMRAKTYFSRKI